MIESSLGGLIEASEVDAFRAAIQQHSPRAIRIRSDRQSSLDSFNSLEAVPWYAPGRLVRSQQGRPSQSLHYAAADYYIQDAGSMLALALLDAQPHEVICDLCAAPGGKASGIGERLDEGGFLLANEPIASRIAILRFAMARTGNPRYAVTQQDPALIASRFAGCFDAVLVDAPCSGQAMVAKGKRDDNAFDQRQIEHSARRQRRILLEACKLLRVGGRLIYSTCTFAVEENEMQLRFLREQFPDAWEPIDSPGLRPWASRIEPGCYRVWPHRDPTSGAFAGGLKLVDSIASRLGPLDHLARPRTRSSSAKSPKRSPIRPKEELASFGQLQRIHVSATGSNSIVGLADDIPKSLLESLDEHEWPLLATVHAGISKPDYVLAMLGRTWFEPSRNVELDGSAARKLVAGEALSRSDFLSQSANSVVEIHGAEPWGPWGVVVWKQKPLGWAKFTGQRANNHLPKLAKLSIGTADEFAP